MLLPATVIPFVVDEGRANRQCSMYFLALGTSLTLPKVGGSQDLAQVVSLALVRSFN